MPSNSEMYERGAIDAEQDDLNSFYYQHYYSYRRGYDETRRQLRGGFVASRPPWLVPLLSFFGGALTLLLVGLIAYWLVAPGAEANQAALALTTSSTAAAQVAAPSAATSPTPAPTLTPIPAPTLRVGGRARVVNVGDAPLRARAMPGLSSTITVVARFPQGSTVTIIEGPREVDGLAWWKIAGEMGEGWSIERLAEGTLFLEPVP